MKPLDIFPFLFMLKLKDEAYGKENSIKSPAFKRQSTEDLATAGEV